MTTPIPSPGPSLPATLARYTLARLGVVAIVTAGLLLAGVPLVIAVLVGFVVALPLSMVLFKGMRGRLDTALAAAVARRSVEREALRAQLRGDVAPLVGPGEQASDDAAHRQPDGGGGRPAEQ